MDGSDIAACADEVVDLIRDISFPSLSSRNHELIHTPVVGDNTLGVILRHEVCVELIALEREPDQWRISEVPTGTMCWNLGEQDRAVLVVG